MFLTSPVFFDDSIAVPEDVTGQGEAERLLATFAIAILWVRNQHFLPVSCLAPASGFCVFGMADFHVVLVMQFDNCFFPGSLAITRMNHGKREYSEQHSWGKV